ncbi:MAG: hypothetical protein HW421_656 [Ignavibacteria bacterium]|nr:hypothetical protein [Ignavibacteria bacterium]
MKKVVLFFVLLSIFSTPLLAQETLHFKRTKGPYGLQITDIKFDSKNNIYVTGSLVNQAPLALFKSENNGNSWVNITFKIPVSIKSLNVRFDSEEDYLYVISINYDTICISRDGGSSWNIIPTNLKAEYGGRFLTSPEGILFIQNSSNNITSLYKSDDNGKNWKKLSGIIDNKYITGFAFGKNGKMLIMSPNNNPIYNDFIYTSNYGETWKLIPRNIYETGTFNKLVVLDSYIIYAMKEGVYRSSDEGSTWESYYEGLYRESRNYLLRNSKDELFLNQTNSILKSIDSGKSWFYIYDNNDLSVGNFNFFTLNQINRLFLVNTSGMIFYSVEPLSVDNPENDNQQFLSPNPANDYIDICLNKGACSLVPICEIRIFNVLGECVMAKQTTSNVQRVDISQLQPGMYFVRVGERTEKFIKW